MTICRWRLNAVVVWTLYSEIYGNCDKKEQTKKKNSRVSFHFIFYLFFCFLFISIEIKTFTKKQQKYNDKRAGNETEQNKKIDMRDR